MGRERFLICPIYTSTIKTNYSQLLILPVFLFFSLFAARLRNIFLFSRQKATAEILSTLSSSLHSLSCLSVLVSSVFISSHSQCFWILLHQRFCSALSGASCNNNTFIERSLSVHGLMLNIIVVDCFFGRSSRDDLMKRHSRVANMKELSTKHAKGHFA